MKHKLIFVSTPYSHEDEDVKMDRQLTVKAYVAKLMNEGLFAYSPIASCLDLAKKHDLPTDWDYWNNYCEAMLERCDIMHVIMMEGWDVSTGVKEEIAIATELNIPIIYMIPDDTFLQHYNSHKRMMKAIEDFHLSPEGQIVLDEFRDKMEREDEIQERHLIKFYEKYDSQFVKFVERYIKKYDSDEYIDRCYNKGYEPSTPMFHFFYDYASKYGREASNNEYEKYGNDFTGSLVYIHGYFFNMMHGQGTVILITKEEG